MLHAFKHFSSVVVLRDWNGKMVDSLVKSAKVFSGLQGKLQAIREACAMILALGIKGVETEADNQQAVVLVSLN